ncbi:MAG: extracellular solute-binding protein [Treponema sp.]|nr:extracellular solute-binding protein [Treponema sp.]
MKKIPAPRAVSWRNRARGRPRYRAALLAVLGFFSLAGCSGKQDAAAPPRSAGSQKLSIYQWTYYTPDSILEKFKKEYGCTLDYDNYTSNEELYAKLQASGGGAGYDIVFPSGDYVSIMKTQGMLEKIDKSKLSNLGNIDPLILKRASYDPAMEYSVPYYFGAAGIVVNTNRVPDFERSWSIFARQDLKDKMTMLDDMREVLGDALAYLGRSVNTKDPNDIAQARDLVNNIWKPNLLKFDADNMGKGFAQEDFWVVQSYVEAVYAEIDESQKAYTAFFIPPEGGPAYIDSMCILKGAKNLDLAYKFIDFIHRPEIYAEFTDYFRFPSAVNIPARDLQTQTPHYTIEDLNNTELKEDLGEDLALYDQAWQSVRVGK